uniref:Palmdelphin n=1 Tax=Zeugodacus cucurbitae TaxID=28588 RepID=A0A0A1XKE8_ZEUCU
MFSLSKRFAYSMFRAIFYKMMQKIRTTKNRTDATPSVLVLVLLFVIIYYCGYRIRRGYKTDFDLEYGDMRGSWDLNDTLDFGESDEKYVVFDGVCKIPRINPFTAPIAHERPPDANCATGLQRAKPLVSKRLDNITDRYYLHINEQWKPFYLRESAELTCCFTEIKNAQASVDKPNGTPCYIFKQDFFISLDMIGIIVKCMQRGDKKIIFMDAFSFMHKRNFSKTSRDEKKIGVLLLGLDSLSQINLRRRMPNTYRYLKENKNQWHELLGFNKLGYDAFPNLMALLTGHNLQTLEIIYGCKQGGILDKCPFLWRQVSAMSMPTAYAEDCVRGHNTATLRFQGSPTDYYLVPFMQTIEQLMQTDAHFIRPQYCVGPRLQASYVWNYAVEFAQSFAGHGGLGLFWLNSVSEHHVIPKMIDDEFTKYLELLQTSEILENYVVILLSANGMMHGRLSKLESGFYEERLPFLFISLPQAWRSTHLALFQAIQLNRNRLVSPLDLYQTIQHVLALGAGEKPHLMALTDCPNCQSCLRPIMGNRSCNDAGIDWFWCSCEPFIAKVANSHATSLIMRALLTHLNDLLKQARLLNRKCGVLSVRTIYGIYNDQEDSDYYYVKFKASLKNAEFELALWYSEDEQKILLDESKLNRLDHEAIGCVASQNRLLSKLCVCLHNE